MRVAPHTHRTVSVASTAPPAELAEGDTEASSEPPSPSLGAAAITHSFCGTEQYMAPEVLLQKGHSKAVDYWSLGILLSEMLTGKHPFRGPSHIATLKNIVSPSACVAATCALD